MTMGQTTPRTGMVTAPTVGAASGIALRCTGVQHPRASPRTPPVPRVARYYGRRLARIGAGWHGSRR